uniref:Uncharacterized protein n=1 Tax=Rhizophora mucronata TaxID=61149 RepID=A0A2P2QG58_RHIMU
MDDSDSQIKLLLLS